MGPSNHITKRCSARRQNDVSAIDGPLSYPLQSTADIREPDANPMFPSHRYNSSNGRCLHLGSQRGIPYVRIKLRNCKFSDLNNPSGEMRKQAISSFTGLFGLILSCRLTFSSSSQIDASIATDHRRMRRSIPCITRSMCRPHGQRFAFAILIGSDPRRVLHLSFKLSWGGGPYLC